jgi:hypothetical protein
MAHGGSCCERDGRASLHWVILLLFLIGSSWIAIYPTAAFAATNSFSKTPSCSSAQLRSYRSPAVIRHGSISGTLYFKNLGTRCSVKQGEVGVQTVTGTSHSPIGLSTMNDVVAYPAIILNTGQLVTASFVVRLLLRSAVTTCGRNSVMGIVVRRPIAKSLAKYFKIPAAHVCTNNFVSIFGSLLSAGN